MFVPAVMLVRQAREQGRQAKGRRAEIAGGETLICKGE